MGVFTVMKQGFLLTFVTFETYKAMHSSPTQFALAIVFPGSGTADVVAAAVRHYVHIVDRAPYDPAKDYAALSKKYEPYVNGSRILLLFVFAEGYSVLADDDRNLDMAIGKIREMSN